MPRREHDRVGLLAVRLRIERIVVVGREARRLFISTIGEGSWDGEAVFFETADEAFDYLRVSSATATGCS
jgi:UDP-N-acetylmuramoyl-tripeptide--D-alanyl-D-alanine ligase